MKTRSRRAHSAAAGLGSVFAVMALACQPSSTPATLEDTPENRSAQIDRYFVAQPPEAVLKDITEKMSAQMPEEHRVRFVDLMTKQLDVAKISTAMRESMAKHFTADELRALADFYGSEIGRSAMAKFGNYMADVMPTIQTEVMAAVAKVQNEFSAAPPEQPAPEQEPQEPAPPQEPPKG
jgi:hypothetical protein